MGWLYKYLSEVAQNNDICTKTFCTTCGAREFRATILTKLKIYNKIPNIKNLSKTNNESRFIAPLFIDLKEDIQNNIVDEISVELKKFTEDQISQLEELRKDFPVLKCLLYELDGILIDGGNLYSILDGYPAGRYLKKLIDVAKVKSF
tara:strand:+ start:120 stop:563 length:444 start_codon:yes stop_codon:yes gene_type:complete